MIETGLTYFSDILLGIGALAAALYCVVLSRKLNGLTDLDQELGSAIALLSQQVDEMTAALDGAQQSATRSQSELAATIVQAQKIERDLKGLSALAPEKAVDHSLRPGSGASYEADSGGLKDGATSLFLRHKKRVIS